MPSATFDVGRHPLEAIVTTDATGSGVVAPQQPVAATPLTAAPASNTRPTVSFLGADVLESENLRAPKTL